MFLVLGRIPSLAPTIRDAWPILHTETLIVGTACAAFWLGGWVLTLALMTLTARTGYEAAFVANRRHALAPAALIGAGIAGLAALATLVPFIWLAAMALAIAALLIVLTGINPGGPDSAAAVALDLALFPTLPLVVFTAAGLQDGYGPWLLAAFLLVETFDSYSLLGGKLFGRHKAFRVLSPNKTVEGLAIGALMLMLTAALVGALLAALPVLASGAVALFVGALTLTGDLTASRLKRRSGVKDYPPVLPRQGGLLDITDAWITAGAGIVVLATLLGFT